MRRTRRGVLGVALGAGLAGLAGCAGVDGVEYPADPPADTPGETVSTAATDADASAVDDAAEGGTDRLADATRRVVDDALWFATEYEAAVRAYRTAIADVVAEADDVRETVRADEAVTVALADRLADAGASAADRAGDVLEPHFTPRERIAARTERHVEVLRNFADRDDVDRFLEELDRMRRGFAGIGTRPYVERAFSRDPVHNRLLHRLLDPLPADAAAREAVLETTLVELGVASEGFTTVARRPYDRDAYDRDQIPRVYGDAIDGDRRDEIRARLGPVVQPDDRTAELFVVFADRPQPRANPADAFEGWYHDLGGTVVHVQRYPDAAVAARRLDAVTAAGRTEDVEPIDPEAGRATMEEGDDDAPTRWHRFLHHEARGERYRFDDHAGVQYGYVVRAGEFLLATGFSGDAWEERAGWQGPLANGWAIR